MQEALAHGAASWAVQPFTATDLAAFAFGVLGALFLVLWARDREPGMQWLGLTYGLLGVAYGWRDHMLPSGPEPNTAWSVLIVAMLVCCALGVTHYVRTPARARPWLYAFMLTPSALILVSFALQLHVHRPYTALPVAFAFTGICGLLVWASRHEPRAGHAYVAAALLSLPVCLFGAALLGFDSFFMQFYALPPLLLFGLTVLTVSLLRRRRQLEDEIGRRLQAEHRLELANQSLVELNASLEARIADRTRDLSEMVEGLEGFTRNVSHDLRGPLGGIAELARLAADRLGRDDAAAAQQVLRAIAEQADLSSRLMTALLTLARVGEAKMHLGAVRPAPLVEEVWRALAAADPSAARTRILVGEMPEVVADADLLRVAFANLLGNALKFSREAEQPCIEVSAVESAGTVEIEVSDNGEGFDAQAASGMFQPFVRLHGTRYEGHGVGLSIVRKAVERQGGSVSARSAGRGASFRIRLPAAPRPAGDAALH